MSAIPFDKKLAELDAYLQMLISENEALDKKISNFSRASNATINNYENELEGIINIKNNLENLLSSIKHSIVLLQIAKVSSRASFSSAAGELKPIPPATTPSPPTRSKFRALKSTSFSTSKDTNHNKLASRADSNKRLNESSSSSSSVLSARLGNSSPQEGEQQWQQHTGGAAGIVAVASSSLAEYPTEQPSFRQGDSSHQTPPPPSRPSRTYIDTTVLKGSPAGTAGISRGCESDATNGVSKGYTTYINNSSKNSNGPHANETTPSSSSRIYNSDGIAIDTAVAAADTAADDDDDDDDAFFDAADVQQSQSKSISNVDTPGVKTNSQSSFQANHPDTSPLKGDGTISTLTASNNRARNMPLAQSTNMAETNNNIDGQMDDDSIEWDALYEEENEDELGSLEGQGSVIKHLLSQIRIGMDLTKVVLPTFILERRSLLEMYADFFAHPDLFSAIPDFETPEERMIQLVRWYLSAFHAGRKSSLAKKPYNPILGEIFKCEWRILEAKNDENKQQGIDRRSNNRVVDTLDDSNNAGQQHHQQLTFVAEQVSHHPPVSAFYAENKEKSISCCAHIYTKSKYLGLSVGVHNIGKGVINLLKHNETYVCTFPSAYGRSILTVPWVELGGPVTITCEQTGYKANIEFIMKPFYGGKKHRVTGEILRPNNEPILTIDGEWNGVMFSKSPPHSSGKQVFVDTTSLPVIKKRVRPVTTQDSFESRNVWKEVTRALKLKDVNSATAAKSFIEQRQRDLLKDRLEKGIKWKTRYFEPLDDGWQYADKTQFGDNVVANEDQ